MAQLAKEADSLNQRRNRTAVGWQEPDDPAEIRDVVDHGDSGLMVENTDLMVATSSQPFSIGQQSNENKNQGARWGAGDDADYEVMEQIDLDQITEAEIDSPVREAQAKKTKKKEIRTKTKSSTSRSTQPKNGKTKTNSASKDEDTELHPPSIFDFSSDDDTDMAPAFKDSDFVENLDMEMETHEDENYSFKKTAMDGENGANTTRNTGRPKSSRQKGKAKEIPASNLTLRKGSRKRVPRTEQKY